MRLMHVLDNQGNNVFDPLYWLLHISAAAAGEKKWYPFKCMTTPIASKQEQHANRNRWLLLYAINMIVTAHPTQMMDPLGHVWDLAYRYTEEWSLRSCQPPKGALDSAAGNSQVATLNAVSHGKRWRPKSRSNGAGLRRSKAGKWPGQVEYFQHEVRAVNTQEAWSGK